VSARVDGGSFVVGIGVVGGGRGGSVRRSAFPSLTPISFLSDFFHLSVASPVHDG